MQFAPTLVAKLKERADRFEERTQLISTPEVATDGGLAARSPAGSAGAPVLSELATARRARQDAREAEKILAECRIRSSPGAREDLASSEPEKALDRETGER
jgi:hypothetical protein